MNHLVTLDAGANEIGNLIKGTKTMIIHGADVKCNPYGTITEGDVLYLVNEGECTEVRAKGIVSSVYYSCRLSVPESYEMIIRNQDKLTLPDDLFYRWAGKRYLLLVELRNVEEIQSFTIDRSALLNPNGWSPVGNVEESVFRDCRTA